MYVTARTAGAGRGRGEPGERGESDFDREQPPGSGGLSEVTGADTLDISLGGLALPHRLYQFALAHSGWRHVRVVLGGESFQSLADGLQDALWMAGGVPEEHRTDSLSAAFNNLAEREELTQRYHALCQHYGLRPTRNNVGVSHENGAIEARQGSLKTALDQSLLLRGSREFADLTAYEQFVAETVRRLNARCARAWEADRPCLRPLPARRTAYYEVADARASQSGVFTPHTVLCSRPARAVRDTVKVRWPRGTT